MCMCVCILHTSVMYNVCNTLYHGLQSRLKDLIVFWKRAKLGVYIAWYFWDSVFVMYDYLFVCFVITVASFSSAMILKLRIVFAEKWMHGFLRLFCRVWEWQREGRGGAEVCVFMAWDEWCLPVLQCWVAKLSCRLHSKALCAFTYCVCLCVVIGSELRLISQIIHRSSGYGVQLVLLISRWVIKQISFPCIDSWRWVVHRKFNSRHTPCHSDVIEKLFQLLHISVWSLCIDIYHIVMPLTTLVGWLSLECTYIHGKTEVAIAMHVCVCTWVPAGACIRDCMYMYTCTYVCVNTAGL